ncbi:mediator of RNA polymerase II transcription subunit 15a-like [Rosa rugosa]|uniref:mediator of RNA polymerase II transcription subunit 15a-like n=1 Tax=Rosa rugosa TaxID=74645 RepID=UPI002B410D61|nr:mediator of RNA polymerase II transcription subunit 15a-like [Rosa rugosa]
MDANYWSPSQGGEQSMYVDDWRSQLLPDLRQVFLNKIMDTLKRHLPFSGPEGLLELQKIAARFEEKVYTAATSQLDYERKISLKMLTMETKSQNTRGSSIQFNSASNSKRLPDPVLMNTSNNGWPPQGGGPSMDTSDWSQLPSDAQYGWQQGAPQQQRQQTSNSQHYYIYSQQFMYQQQLQQQLLLQSHIQLQQEQQQIPLQKIQLQSSQQSASVMQPSVEPLHLSVQPSEQLPPDARHRIVNKITNVLKRNPSCGQMGLPELERIAATLEEKIYAVASSQADYLRKVSLKMLTMETQITAPPSNDSLESLFASLDLQD